MSDNFKRSLRLFKATGLSNIVLAIAIYTFKPFPEALKQTSMPLLLLSLLITQALVNWFFFLKCQANQNQVYHIETLPPSLSIKNGTDKPLVYHSNYAGADRWLIVGWLLTLSFVLTLLCGIFYVGFFILVFS